MEVDLARVVLLRCLSRGDGVEWEVPVGWALVEVVVCGRSLL